MRLSSILSVTMAITYSVICSATANSDQTNLSMMRSPDLVRPLDPAQNVDAAGRRFLREHEKAGAEERVFSLSEFKNKLDVKKLAKAVLADPAKADDAYVAWASKGYTLNDIKKFLNIDKRDKYLWVYNGYVSHMYQ